MQASVGTQAFVIEIPKDVIGKDHYNTLEAANELTEKGFVIATKYARDAGAKRGDVIRLAIASGPGGYYRNEGAYIYDGEQVVGLCYDIDDYGSVPSQFTPLEEGLPLDYWGDIIDHNGIIWVRTNTITEGLIGKPLRGKPLGHKGEVDAVYIKFMYKGQVYIIISGDGEDYEVDLSVLHKLLRTRGDTWAFETQSPSDGTYTPNVLYIDEYMCLTCRT